MDEKVVEAMDDEIIERAMNEMMMMNVELTMKIVEFGTVEICELMRYEEISMKVDECGATWMIKSESFETKTMNE